MLQAAGTYLERGIPLLGINLGTLGYLAEIEKNAWKEALLRVFSDNYEIENRMMLEGLCPDGRVRYALNDVVISRNGPPQILGFDVFVNGQFLNTFSADGILLSTPTGSTAYNLSAGGPIVEPSARLILLTPVCPHTLNNRSIVLSPEDEVRIGVGHPSRSLEIEAGAVFDGLPSENRRKPCGLSRWEERAFLKRCTGKCRDSNSPRRGKHGKQKEPT